MKVEFSSNLEKQLAIKYSMHDVICDVS